MNQELFDVLEHASSLRKRYAESDEGAIIEADGRDVVLLADEVVRLQKELENANARALRFANRMDDTEDLLRQQRHTFASTGSNVYLPKNTPTLPVKPLCTDCLSTDRDQGGEIIHKPGCSIEVHRAGS